MRKQFLAGLMAVAALLFGVVALTGSPASGDDYPSYLAYPAYPSGDAKVDISYSTTVAQGDSGIVTLPAGTAEPGTDATVWVNGTAVGFAVVSPDGGVTLVFTVPLDKAVGEGDIAISYTPIGGGEQLVIAATITITAATVSPPVVTPGTPAVPGVPGTPATPATPAVPAAPAAPAGPVVVHSANNYGFGTSVPTVHAAKATALAHTGSESSVLGFIATGLIAAGAIVMGSRRTFLQGALED